MPTSKTYTVETLTPSSFDEKKDLIPYFQSAGRHLASIYGDKFDWRNFKIRRYALENRITVCRHQGRLVGFMLARTFGSIFDGNVKILFQDSLYAEPGTRAAHALMRDFIDFGKSNANHIISAIGAKTNVKQRSLERLGFRKIEELYRIEV